MPPTDPADLIAQARHEMGLSRQLKQPRLRLPPDLSCRGSTGYEEWFRERQIEKWENDEPIDVSESSLKRWRKRLVCYRPTGNHPRTQIIGHDMINLVTFLVGYPDATADEVIIFLYNQGGALYSRQVVYERLKELNITRKRASTEAYQASRPDVLHRKWTFWNCPPPLGVVGVPRRKFIDVDEFGIALEKCNRSYGWAPKIFRVRKEGHYTRGLKLTVLIVFEPGDPVLHPDTPGSIQRPRRWVRALRGTGTTINVFRDFVNSIRHDIEQNGHDGTDDHRIFLWDNLNSHHAGYVHQTVVGREGPRQFNIIARPPYHPQFGPIEYAICQVSRILKLSATRDWNVDILEAEVVQAAHSIPHFNSTFEHCGYSV